MEPLALAVKPPSVATWERPNVRIAPLSVTRMALAELQLSQTEPSPAAVMSCGDEHAEGSLTMWLVLGPGV